MTVKTLIDSGQFQVLHEGTDTSGTVSGVFCCDLLSVAMAKGKERAAWVTVMGNVNALAVLKLTDMACIILAEGATLDDAGKEKAVTEDVTVLQTKEAVFETALSIHEMIS